LPLARGIIGAAVAWGLRCAADAACLFWAARLADRTLGKMLLPPFLLLLSSAVFARHTAYNPVKVITAAMIIGLFAATLAVIIADDLVTLVKSAVRRVGHPLMRIVCGEI
jgi:hypothetical protein